MGKSTPKQRVTEYYSSVQYGICHGVVDKFISIRVNDKVVGKCGSVLGPVTYIDEEDLFGGVKKEGGLRGRMAVQYGTADQLLDAYVASKKGRAASDLPGYRGIATAYFTEAPASESAADVGSIMWNGGLFPNVPGVFGTSLFGRKSTSPMKGFYWSANQPYVPPVHFRVTRIDRTWMPDIAAIPGDVDLSRLAICIAIDVSSSMEDDGKIGIAKDAVVKLLQDMKASPEASTIDIRVVGWSTSVQALEKRDCEQSDYDQLITFVENLDTGGGTDFTKAVVNLANFYDDASGKCRVFMFLTDGAPVSAANATAAAEILLATGASSHAFNLVLTDTTQTEKMDNTPIDGVPVINLSTAPILLENLFRGGTVQQVDMNPAHMIRECLTNTAWGLGLPETFLDDDMFASAAETLFSERFGLSIMWTRQSPVQDFIGEILSHIQGTIYTNPMTGKLCLKLIRDDYDPETLDVLTPSNCTVTSFKRRTPAEVTNEINVTWTNPASEKEEVVSRQSLGSIVANNGEVVSDNRNYFGITRAALAVQICDRDLSAAAAPLCTAEVTAHRGFSNKVPGDVVKLTDPENGAYDVIMRVMKIDYGYVGSSAVQLSLSEDIFSYAKPRFVAPVTSQNASQAKYPVPPEYVEMFTTNAFLNASLADGATDISDPETQAAFLVSTSATDTFTVQVESPEISILGESEYVSIGQFGLAGRSAISAALPQEAESSLVLPVPSVGVSPNLGNFVIFGPVGLPESNHEIALITAFDFDTGQYTISRAQMDTTPREWPIGTPVRYLNQETRFLNPKISTAGISENYRFRTVTSLGTLSEALSPVVAYSPTDRLYAPARPANVKVNDIGFGIIDAMGVTSFIVTWSNRNRLTEDSVLLKWDEAPVTPEVGQTTTIKLFNDETDTLITEFSGLTGNSYTFSAAALGSVSYVRVSVYAARDGFESIQAHSVVLDNSPFLPPGDLSAEVTL